MKINYVRTIKSSYMQIEHNSEGNSYDREMLQENQIRGLLPIAYCKNDDQLICSYDITGKQPLDVIFETKDIDYNMLFQILSGLCSTLEKIEHYLLDPGKILLLPETIYQDHDMGKLWFCYYMDQETELSENFRGFWEYVLKKLNHKDEKVVEIAYQIYDEVLKTGYSLALIREKLHLRDGENEIRIEEPGTCLTRSGEERIPAIQVEDVKPEIRHKIFSADAIKESFTKHTQHFAKKQLKKIKDYFIPVSKTTIEPFVFEPEEIEEKQNLPTVLLAERKEEIHGILQYEGEHGLQNLTVDIVPYLIGSGADCMGIISSDTVSRIHARITKTEDIYFIEDLNSSNGTEVGGRQLPCKMKVSLQKNEVILFADEKFRFI